MKDDELLAKRLKEADNALAEIIPIVRERNYGIKTGNTQKLGKRMLNLYKKLLHDRAQVVAEINKTNPMQRLKQRGARVKPKTRRPA